MIIQSQCFDVPVFLGCDLLSGIPFFCSLPLGEIVSLERIGCVEFSFLLHVDEALLKSFFGV